MSSNLPVEHNPGDPAAVSTAGASSLPVLAGEFPAAGFTAPEDEAPSVDMKRYFAAIMRYKWLIPVLTVLGGGIGVLLAKVKGPVYEAQSTIWIELGGRNG